MGNYGQIRNNLNLIRVDDLINNPAARLPICLCLDTSASMRSIVGGNTQATGETRFIDGKMRRVVRGGIARIDELNRGIHEFYQSLLMDDLAVESVEIGIVTFNDKAECAMDFANIERQGELHNIVLEANGETAIGEGVNLALDLLEQRKQEYQDKGVDYYRPWLILMTDGESTGNKEAYEAAAGRTLLLEQNRHLQVFPIKIGDEVGSTLDAFSKKTQPYSLDQAKFKEFFGWLTDSAKRISESMPGENIKLPTVEPWISVMSGIRS